MKYSLIYSIIRDRSAVLILKPADFFFFAYVLMQ